MDWIAYLSMAAIFQSLNLNAIAKQVQNFLANLNQASVIMQKDLHITLTPLLYSFLKYLI